LFFSSRRQCGKLPFISVADYGNNRNQYGLLAQILWGYKENRDGGGLIEALGWGKALSTSYFEKRLKQLKLICSIA
jgi:hypothetical protein